MKWTAKNHLFLLYAVGALIVILLALILFFIFPKESASIYVYPEKAKQGDTVFIKVKKYIGDISGNFNNQKLLFYKDGNSGDWVSFLGIDADQKPGDYKISVGNQAKNIKVALANFSSSAKSPSSAPAQTGQAQQKIAENIVKNDNSAIKKILNNSTAKPYFTGSFSFPLSKVEISGFSFGKFIGFAKYKLQHFGVDLRASDKTKIYAVNDGKVVFTENLPDYGRTVIIDHGLDIFSLYLHLDEFKVAEGNIVKKGQVIGLSGDSGYSTAPHLHFSMRVGGSRVDPIAFIKTTQKASENPILASITNAFLNIINR